MLSKETSVHPLYDFSLLYTAVV